MSKGKINWRSFAGKGYYIALILCVAAIGITGYLYYRNASDQAEPVVNAGLQDDHVAADAAAKESTAPTTQTLPSLKTALPLSGETVMGYATDCLAYNATTRDWRTHDGIDITAEAGTEVCAAAAGEVYTVYEDDAMGTTVVLRHEGGYVTTYSSLEKAEVTAGTRVQLGQTIGYVGSTAAVETAIGDHVHFSVHRDDTPVDPTEFFELG